MRMSGHLETLLILLEQTIEDENILSNSISQLFTLVAESIRKQDKTIEMIMKSVSFTIICEIGNLFQINERFFWHSSIQKGTNFCLENLIKGQRTRLSAKILLIIFSPSVTLLKLF